MTSETSKHRPAILPYCNGLGLDLGAGGDPITPTAIACDLPHPYTALAPNRQTLQLDIRHDLGIFSNNSLDYVYQSHLLEDLSFPELRNVIAHIHRILRPGGNFINIGPDEQIYRQWCKNHSQAPNNHHQHHDFGLQFFTHFLDSIFPGQFSTVFSSELSKDYSFIHVTSKIP